MSEAARQGDPIAHSSALEGLLLGLAVGAAVALATVSTGGLAAVAIVGAAASGGALVGEVLGSLSVCSRNTGHIISGSPDVYTNGRPAARASLSVVVCSKRGHGANLVAEGSSKVYINGMPASRVGDHSSCGGKISAGSSNVFIGGATVATEDIASEVPGWLHAAVFALGLGSGIGLGLLRTVAWRTLGRGLAGGVVGEKVGYWTGGKVFGEGSDIQKLATLGGAVIGGWATIRGGQWFNARYQIKVEGLGSNLGNVRIVRRPDLPPSSGKGISQETYNHLRARTPSKKIQSEVNEGVSLPMKDPALPGLNVTKPLHADHIVPMKQITQMDGFAELSTRNQLAVLNNPRNFVGLSETANTSKGARSFSEWTEYKKGEVKVDPTFRENMIAKSEALKVELQEQIRNRKTMTTKEAIIYAIKNRFHSERLFFSLGDFGPDLMIPKEWHGFGIKAELTDKVWYPTVWDSYSTRLPWTHAAIRKCLIGTVILYTEQPSLVYIFHDREDYYFYIGRPPLISQGLNPVASLKSLPIPDDLVEFYGRLHNGFTFYPSNSMGPLA